jgi:DNA-binding MarR family transcriptional regulator
VLAAQGVAKRNAGLAFVSSSESPERTEKIAGDRFDSGHALVTGKPDGCGCILEHLKSALRGRAKLKTWNGCSSLINRRTISMTIKEESRYKFLSAMQNVSRAIKSNAADCCEMCGGINEKELFIIEFVGQNKNVTMSDIADNLDAPLSTLTNIVDKLVERKYLSREHGGEDRRVINVMLAENGKTAYKTLGSKKKQIAEKLLSQFNEKEQAAFIEHLNILASALAVNK